MGLLSAVRPSAHESFERVDGFGLECYARLSRDECRRMFAAALENLAVERCSAQPVRGGSAIACGCGFA